MLRDLIDNMLSSNNSSTQGEQKVNYRPAFVILAKIMIPVLTVGIVGNLIKLYYLISTSSQRAPLNILILNQNICDLILSAVIYPGHVTATLFDYKAEGAIAATFTLVFISTQVSVLLSIFFISINRVIAIVFYTRFSRKLRDWVCVIGLVLSWVLPMSFYIPLVSGIVPDIVVVGALMHGMGTVIPADPAGKKGFQLYFVAAITTCVLLPSLGTVFSYVTVWITVKKRRYRVDASRTLPTGNMRKILGKRIRSAKLSGVIALGFFLTYYPFNVATIARAGNEPSSPEFFVVLVFCLWSGCCINPFIYCLCNVTFRYWLLIVCRRMTGWKFYQTKKERDAAAAVRILSSASLVIRERKICEMRVTSSVQQASFVSSR